MGVRRVPWRIRDALIIFTAAWIGLPILIFLGLDWLSSYSSILNNFLVQLANGNIVASFYLLAINALGSLLLTVFFVHRRGGNLSDLGLRRFRFWPAIAFILLGLIVFSLAISLAYEVLQHLLPNFNPDAEQVNEFTRPNSPQTRLLSFLALVVVAPVIEEVVFRGFIFPAFAQKYGLVRGATWASLLFGLAHLQANIAVYTLILGFILCMMYVRLGSIWPGIGFHMLNNFIAFTILI